MFGPPLRSARLRVSRLFLNRPTTTEIYTLSLHDALPISSGRTKPVTRSGSASSPSAPSTSAGSVAIDELELKARSEEHTSELQSHSDLVCRLLLEKKKTNHGTHLQLAATNEEAARLSEQN